jgi:hypothetical protein
MEEITTVGEYLNAISLHQQRQFKIDYPSVLFRGKRKSQQLIANIYRLTKNIKRPISFERERLSYLRGRLGLDKYTEWDAVAIAQHYGIATRFIDWTSNSLIALWFALGNYAGKYNEADASEVCILKTKKEDFEIPNNETSPIPEERGSRTVIFAPKNIDRRIVAQDGYLMRQVYEKDNDDKLFIRSVDKNDTFSGRIHTLHITSSDEVRKSLLEELEYYGYDRVRLIPTDKDWQDLSKECDTLSMFFDK